MTMPNEPACPPSPDPSSYAQNGVGGRLGCRCRAISLSVKAYWFIPLGVATTIPAPGNGNGWIYLVSKLRAGPVANACRTVHGRARAALAPAPYFRKFRLVIMFIVSLLFHCRVKITRSPHKNRVWLKSERDDYAFLPKIFRTLCSSHQS